MRIAHVTQPTQAGVAVVVAGLAPHQAARGHEVTVVCPVAEIADGPLRAVRDAGAVGFLDWPATRSPGPSSIAETRRLARLLSAARPDVVVLHSAKAGLAGRLALRGRVPTVFVPHAWSFEAAEGIVRRASTGWEVWAQRWATTTVCVTDGERRRGAELGLTRGRTVVVRNGVDLHRFTPGPAREARALLGLDDVPTVVCVGRLARQKGQDRLLAAWPLVRDRVPTAALVLVGDGPDREALEHQVARDDLAGVHLAGATDDPLPWYRAADVVAFPSRWETGGLVPMEAMACERVVVATDVTGVRENLGETGTVVVDGDDDYARHALADAICAYLLDTDRTARLGREARDVVAERSSLGETLRRWDDLLEDVVREPALPHH